MPDKATSKLLLALDTSGPACSVALADCATGQILAQVSEPMQRGHAEVLVPLVAQIMADHCLSFGSVARIAVCIGPGSFAGLRVGVSAAKGYALASGCEIVGVSGFDAHAKDAAASAWITLDGRRGEVFMQRNGAPDSAVRVNLDDLTNFDFGSDSIHGPFAAETAAAAHLPADRATSTALAADISYIAKLGLAADAATHPATLNYMRGADAKPGAGFSLQRAG